MTRGYAAQFLLALHTAGQDDPLTWGPQVDWDGNPFWNETLPAFLHSLSPATTFPYPDDWIGEIYQPAWYGDGQNYYLPDFIGLFGALGRYYSLTGISPSKLEALRWSERNTPPGGTTGLYDRIAGAEVFRDAILYFLLFDPQAPGSEDPRLAQAPDYFAPGMGKLLARTDWGVDASWFSYALGWIQIDHQQADGNQIAFYRNGEWLTQSRVGWDGANIPCSIGRSDYHNTLALENDQADLEPESWLELCNQHGSQWMAGVASGDGKVLYTSLNQEFAYALGDSTDLYNSVDANATDITHASRSVVWLKPDHIAVYDRAESATANRFKRFWLNIPNSATVNGNLSTVSTDNGQKLFVTTLLPSGASITSAPSEALPDDVANYNSMDHRLRVEDLSAPWDLFETPIAEISSGRSHRPGLHR